ncbi:MAG TPA: ROK family protein [Cyclobacteriaceae bacterium]
MPDHSEIALGIDIGGTSTKMGLVTHDGNVLRKISMPTSSQDLNHSFLEDLKDKINKLLAENNFKLSGIGVGVPMANSKAGTVSNASNLKWEGQVNLRDFIEDAFKVPAFINNDANVAALGEKVYGDAKSIDDFITITLGTGVGCGIISEGRLIEGANCIAGEVGHSIIHPGGRLCGCGRRGCLETYVSAVGIRRTVNILIGRDNYISSKLSKLPYEELNAEKIYNAAADGDQLAQEAFRTTGETLGLQLANLVLFSNPKVIYLMGGLTKAGDLIFEPTRRAMEENLLKGFKGTVEILPSKLTDNNSPILGASAQVWQSIK